MISTILQIAALIGFPIGAAVAFGPGGLIMALSVDVGYVGLAMEPR